MNYPITLACLGFFGGHNLDLEETRKAGGYRGARPLDGVDFANAIDTVLGWYDPQITLAQLNLLDSHDTPRFITSVREDWSALKLAYLVLVHLSRRAVHLLRRRNRPGGKHDPDAATRSRGTSRAGISICWLTSRSCIALRKAYPALRRGSYHRLYADREVVAFGRWLDRDKLVVVLNASTATKTIDIPRERDRVDRRRAGRCCSMSISAGRSWTASCAK